MAGEGRGGGQLWRALASKASSGPRKKQSPCPSVPEGSSFTLFSFSLSKPAAGASTPLLLQHASHSPDQATASHIGAVGGTGTTWWAYQHRSWPHPQGPSDPHAWVGPENLRVSGAST